MNKERIVRRSGRLVVGALSLCVLIEAGSRVFYRLNAGFIRGAPVHEDIFPPILSADADTEFSNKRGVSVTAEMAGRQITYRLNSLGVRGPERPYAKPVPHQKRIVLLGGSRVFGIGVNEEEHFGSVLERRLKNVEVINLGVCGFRGSQAVRLFWREGILYQPDLVIYEISHDTADRLLLWTPYPPLNFVRRWLRARSFLFRRFEGAELAVAAWTHREAAEVCAFSRKLHARGVPLLLVTWRGDIIAPLRRCGPGTAVLELDPGVWRKGAYSISEAIGHLNPRGNEVLADLIVSTIRAEERLRRVLAQ